MPTGVLHLKEVDTDEITLDGTLSVSGASTLEGATVAHSTLSVGGAATFTADTEATNINVGGTLSVSGQTTIGGDIIPDTNDAYDIGSPEFKIRDMYVSDNSLWIGDTTKISNVGGSLKFRKRKTDVVPKAILDAGASAGHANEQATANAALQHAGVDAVGKMRLQHWHRFMKTLNAAAKLTDIFRDNDDDYEETSASDAWKEITDTNKIYTNLAVGVGTSDPDDTLHVKGSFKVESETGFKLIRSSVGGTDPTVIIDTQNFGTDETVNDLTGRGDAKYTKLYRVYGRNSEGVGRSWYWGYANDDYANISLAFDGGGVPDPDIAFTFTTASELHCNKVYAALGGNADTATTAALAAEATKLATPRKINGVDFDGTQDITLSTEATKLATPVNINGVAFDGSSDIQINNISVSDAKTYAWSKICGDAPTDEYNFLLFGPRPGTTSGGATHFINGEGRTQDGGVSTYTIRNDSGNLRLGRAGFTTKIEGTVEFANPPSGLGGGSDLIEAAGGDYAAVNVNGSRNGWGGYSIFNQWNLMAHTNHAGCGIYDDGTNKWSIHCDRNSYTYLYFNGDWKMRTESYGIYVNNDLYVNRVGFGHSISYRIEKSAGDYMTVTTQGSRGNWGGYAIQNQWGLMAHTNGGSCGIYNDQDNQWGLECIRNNHTYLHWNGLWKMRTEDYGINVNGMINTSGGYIVNREDSSQTISGADFRWCYGGTGHVSHANYGGHGDWYIRSNNSAGKVIIQDSGGTTSKCGIGTSQPDYKLDVRYGDSDNITKFQVRTGGTIYLHRNHHSQPELFTTMSSGYPGVAFRNGSNVWVMRKYGNTLDFDFNGVTKGYVISSRTNPMNFTGQHRTFIHEVPFSKAGDMEGLIVSANKNEYIKMNGGIEIGCKAITINESLPVVSLSAVATDKKCFGVISTSEDPERRIEEHGMLVTISEKELGDTRVYINSVGEGAIWVTNVNGPLESGDYITSSDVAGYGQKQDSEFLANYTVAKITMDCDFKPVTQPVRTIRKEMGDVNYWVKTTYENVSEEEYFSLPDDMRRMTESEDELVDDLIYQKIIVTETQEEAKKEEGSVLDVRRELVNVLDEHGQLQWAVTGDTEKAYKIRYLLPDGLQISEEEYNFRISIKEKAYIAAFVGCTYHCG